MSLRINLENAFTRIGTEFKTIRTMIGGSGTATIAALTTADKSSLVAAINEIKAAAGATNLDALTDVAITNATTGHVLRHNGTQFVNDLGTTHFQPRNATLDALAALSTTSFGRALLTLVDSAGLTGQVRVATSAVTGVVQLASNAEAQTGTDATKAVTPAALAAAIAGKANTSGLAAIATSGSASDLITGTIPSAVLPPLAITDVFVVASQAAMLALTAQRGDIAKRTDTGRTYILQTDAPGTLGNWIEVTSQGDVLSVAGRTGAVVLTKADVGLSNVDNTADASKPISTATQTALDGKQASNPNLSAIGALVSASDRLPYATGASTWALAVFTSFGRSLVATADAQAARDALVVYSQAQIGDPETNFQTVFEGALT